MIGSSSSGGLYVAYMGRLFRSEEITSFPGHNGDVWSVACDADGALLASGGADRCIRLWKRSDEQMFIEEVVYYIVFS